jgi:magnesium-transporting ATPase (P-type)
MSGVLVAAVAGSQGQYVLYSKGADSKILSRLCDDADASVEPTNRAVAEWGEDGLRTLVFAYRLLSPADFERFFEEFHRANADVQEKAKHDAHIMPNAVDDAMDSVERELVLLGATANEDELQDGVPDTIATLSEAGIKVWMLTGDKMETAVNIAFATQLVRGRCCRALLAARAVVYRGVSVSCRCAAVCGVAA